MSSFEKASLWVVKIGLWALPVLPLYVSGYLIFPVSTVSNSMLFPFITGKNFAFRIITEIIFAVWVGLAVARPEYRPRATPLFKIITVFVGIVFLADLLSPHPYRSFFSNYERMEGFMMIGHMYIFFLMLTSVFRTRRDWMTFFHVSLAASVWAAGIGILQKLGYASSIQGGFRVDSTIGNPTYFAAYLLFHVWMLVLLMYEYGKVRWRVGVYAATLVFELLIIYFTATRGVVLALALAIPPFLAALVYFWDRIAVFSPTGWSAQRTVAAGLLVLSLIAPLVFWSIRKTEIVQANPALQRLTNYSFREGTIQDRVLIWKMSLKGVMERPILGWGQENYYLVFQKYFEPGLYDAEAWFDRSHNVFLDWAVHTGIPGLAAYLGILGVALWQIIRAMRRDRTVFFTGIALIGLLTTDFFQKIFVFDNFTSYFLFFAFLAYSERVSSPAAEPAPVRRRAAAPYGAAAAACMLALAAGWSWWANAIPMRESRKLINVLQLVRSNVSVDVVEAGFRDVLDGRSFGDTEAREQLGNLARDIAGNTQGQMEVRKRFTDFALAELRKEIADPVAADVKHMLFILSILNRALPLDPQYAAEAEAVAQKILERSPTKQIAYFEVAQLYLNLNKLGPALDLLERAWRLAPQFQHAGQYAWTLAALAKKPELADEVRRAIPPEKFEDFALVAIAAAYQQVGDIAAARELYAALVKKSPSSAQYHATYAALLAHEGKAVEARRAVEEAIRLDPGFEKEGKQFLETLR